MKNVFVITALVLTSSLASAVTVRGSARYYTNGASIKTVKEACETAATVAKNSLTAKCALLEGEISSTVSVVLDPMMIPHEGSCVAYAEVNCQ